MRYAALQLEPFSFNQGENEGELLEMEQFEYLESEVNRNTPNYIRWVQDSLNKILGLQLKVDGIMGSQTRSAIRNFQQKQRLVVDGVVGPATIRTLIKAGAAAPSSNIVDPEVIKPADARLDRFDFDKSDLKPHHISEIDKIATKIVNSWRSGPSIMTVRVIGHTDPEGKPDYNVKLGLRRALAVRKALGQALEKKQRNLSYKVLILADSRGEYELIDVSNTPEGKARNRRVEIYLSTKALKPLPKPKPKVIELPPIEIIGKLPEKCDQNDLNQRLSECERQIRQCINKCETDKNFIWNKIKDNVAIAACFSLGHPAAIAACALSLGGIYYKEMIDEYFRLSTCQEDCKRMLDICQHVARVNSHCLNQ